jgi:hypothetical protein
MQKKTHTPCSSIIFLSIFFFFCQKFYISWNEIWIVCMYYELKGFQITTKPTFMKYLYGLLLSDLLPLVKKKSKSIQVYHKIGIFQIIKKKNHTISLKNYLYTRYINIWLSALFSCFSAPIIPTFSLHNDSMGRHLVI